jgi:hypothetical protein
LIEKLEKEVLRAAGGTRSLTTKLGSTGRWRKG